MDRKRRGGIAANTHAPAIVRRMWPRVPQYTSPSSGNEPIRSFSASSSASPLGHGSSAPPRRVAA